MTKQSLSQDETIENKYLSIQICEELSIILTIAAHNGKNSHCEKNKLTHYNINYIFKISTD